MCHYRNSVLKDLFRRSRDYPAYRSFSRTESASLLEDARMESLLRIIKFIERFMAENEIDSGTEANEAPPDIVKYHQVVFKNIVLRALKQGRSVILPGEPEIIDAINLSGETIAEKAKSFSAFLRAENPRLMDAMDHELIFYSYIITDHLSEDAKIVVDAFSSDDWKLKAKAKERVGLARYYQIKHRLFKRKDFHKIALRVGEAMLENRSHEELGITFTSMLWIIRRLRDQLGGSNV